MEQLGRIFKILIISVVFACIFFRAEAQTVEELNKKISQKNSDISSLEQDIKNYQKQLETLSGQKNSLASVIKQLDLTKKKLEADIKVTQNKIETTNFKITELSLQITDKKDEIDQNKSIISDNLRMINSFDQDTLAEKVLKGEKISDAWKDADDLGQIRTKIIQKTSEIKDVKAGLENVKLATETARAELVSLKSKLTDQKKITDDNTKEKNRLLAQTKNSEAGYNKLLKDRLAKKDALEKEIRDYEAQIKYILDPSKLPGRGVLSWPLDSIFITQEFGATVAAKRLYVSGSHNGTDFRASVGTPVKAMGSGQVLGVGDTDITCPGASFGRWVFIKYNNGLSSTYGHLSLIKAYEGQTVSSGDIVGYSGNTGYSTGPHLHVSIYASDAVKVQNRPSASCSGKVYRMPIAPIGAYLDPMYYLPTPKR